jgi:hypothetical protein
MGAVLGIAAFGRTQEKLNGANNGGATVPSNNFTAPSAPAAGFGAPASGFGAQTSTPAPTTSFTPPASWGTTPVATTASGKKIVPQDDQPAI